MKTKTIIKRTAAFLLSLVLVSGELVQAEAHTHNADCYCNGTISELSYIEEIDPTCTFCGGTGKSACEACNGKGKITTGSATCSECSGSGVVVTEKKSSKYGNNQFSYIEQGVYVYLGCGWGYQYGDVIHITFTIHHATSGSSGTTYIRGHKDRSSTNISYNNFYKIFSAGYIDGSKITSSGTSSVNFGTFAYKKSAGIETKTIEVSLVVSNPSAVFDFGFDLSGTNAFYADVSWYVTRPTTSTCSTCRGTGSAATTVSCQDCNGTGKGTCPVCEGTGKAYVCLDCGGTRYARKNCAQCNGTGEIGRYVTGDYETKEINCRNSFYVLPEFKAGVKHVEFEFDFITDGYKVRIVPRIRKSSSSSIILGKNNKYIENLQITIDGPAWVEGTYIYQHAKQTSHIKVSFDFTDDGLGTVAGKYKQLEFSWGSAATVKGAITYPHAGVSLQKTTCPGCQGIKTFADTSKPCETCSATGTIKVDEPIIYHYTCNVCGEGDYSKAYYGQKCGRKLCADELEMEGACGHTRFAIGEYDSVLMTAAAREGILPYSSSDGTLVIEDVSYLNNGQKDCGAAYLGHCSVCGEPFTVTYYWPDELQTGSYSSSLADVECVAPEVIMPTELTLQIWGETNVLDVREETEISGVFPLADKATSEDDVVILFTSSATSAASTVGLLLNTGEELISLYDALENGIISELSYASLNVSADEAYALTEGSGELPSGSTLALRFCMAKNCAGLTAYTDRDSDSGSSDIVISVKKNDVHTELEWTPIKKAPDVRQSQKNVSQTITRYTTDGVLTSTSSSDTPATVYIPTAEYRIGNIVLDDTAHFRYETRMVGGDAEIKVFIKANSGCSNKNSSVLRIYDTDGYIRDIVNLKPIITTDTTDLTTICSVVFNIDGAETPVNVNKGSLIPASDVPDVHVPSDLVEDHMTTTYTFDGWYTNSNYSGVYDLSSPITSDLSLYGRIESETYVTPSYTVTFVVNGHEISSQTVYEREGAVEPSRGDINAYVPIGNVFRKWDKSFSYITEDTVITAKFQQIISPENQLAETDGEYDCLVRASIGATYLVSIPKKIVLDGGTGLGSYRITVDADLGGMDYISVRPLPSSAEGFVLKEAGGKRDAYFNVYQPKQYFISSATKYPEFISYTGEYVSVSGSAISLSYDCGFDTENGEGMTADATVSANISAGTWKGIVTFEIFLGEKNIG